MFRNSVQKLCFYIVFNPDELKTIAMTMNPFVSDFITEQAQKLGEKLRAKTSERQPGEVIDQILEFLRTADICDLDEISAAIGMTKAETEKILEQMAKVGMIKKGFKITESGMGFLDLPNSQTLDYLLGRTDHLTKDLFDLDKRVKKLENAIHDIIRLFFDIDHVRLNLR